MRLKKSLSLLVLLFLVLASFGCPKTAYFADSYTCKEGSRCGSDRDLGVFDTKVEQDLHNCKWGAKYAAKLDGKSFANEKYKQMVKDCMESHGYEYVGEGE